MKMRNVFVDYAGNETSLGACDFAFIGDFEVFILECQVSHTITNGITGVGLYSWDDAAGHWDKCPSDHEVMKSINKILSATSATAPTDDKMLWDIVVTLDTNDEIVTNDEPVSMAEVYEAINTMRKPSFFGKRIKEIRIISH